MIDMTERQAREVLTRVLRDASVFHLRDQGLETAFIDGHYDAGFEEIALDSLAAMEVCLSLEAGWDSELVPDDLYRAGTIGGLARMLVVPKA